MLGGVVVLSPFQGSGVGERFDPGAARNALAPGYLLPRLRRWLIGAFLGRMIAAKLIES